MSLEYRVVNISFNDNYVAPFDNITGTSWDLYGYAADFEESKCTLERTGNSNTKKKKNGPKMFNKIGPWTQNSSMEFGQSSTGSLKITYHCSLLLCHYISLRLCHCISWICSLPTVCCHYIMSVCVRCDFLLISMEKSSSALSWLIIFWTMRRMFQ